MTSMHTTTSFIKRAGLLTALLGLFLYASCGGESVKPAGFIPPPAPTPGNGGSDGGDAGSVTPADASVEDAGPEDDIAAPPDAGPGDSAIPDASPDAGGQPCELDSQCPIGNLCVEQTCIPGCRSSRDCGDKKCNLALGPNGTCVQCMAKDDCPAGQQCDNNQCVFRCKSDTECSGKRCDTTRGECVQCLSNSDCKLGQICTDAACVEGCRSERDCKNGQVCDTAVGNGRCVQCIATRDCPAGSECVNNICEVRCTSSSQCAAPQKCNTVSGRCVACLVNSDCQLGSVCNNNACVPGCKTDRDCPSGLKCDTAAGPNGGCVECVTSAVCPPERPICSNRKCVQCAADPDCKTAPRNRCDTTKNICVQCTKNEQCPQGGICNTATQTCSEPLLMCDDRKCTSDSECPAGSKCADFDGNKSLRCRPLCTTFGDCNTFQNSSRCSSQGEPVCGCVTNACKSDSDCSQNPFNPQGKCDKTTGRCQECFTSTDCNGGKVCKFNSCTTCATNADCSNNPVGAFCNPSTKLCGECASNSDCTSSDRRFCNANGKCASCLADSDCHSQALLRCLTGRCVGCTSDGDCPQGTMYCKNNFCETIATDAGVSDSGVGDSSIPPGSVGLCQTCTKQADCQSGLKCGLLGSNTRCRRPCSQASQCTGSTLLSGSCSTSDPSYQVCSCN
ncbi:MAG: hypothetical protein GMKNLPBB_00099 [Myxococcota bacterium]|nr:hypothetical protein [Myxococcota bacterium]